MVCKWYVYVRSTCMRASVCSLHVCMCLSVDVHEHTSVRVCLKDPLGNVPHSSVGAGLAFLGRRAGLGSLLKVPRTGELPRTSGDIKATCQTLGPLAVTVSGMLLAFGAILLLRTAHAAGHSVPLAC